MVIGDIYWANILFENRSGSKIRPVVVLDDQPIPTVLVITSTTKYQPNLDLLHSVNFDSPRYFRYHANGLRGESYFYRENVKVLDSKKFVRFAGILHPVDLKLLLNALN